jgi:outer membrane protein
MSIAPLLLLLGTLGARQDTLPVVTLADALARAVRLDPGYVQALVQVDNAEAARRTARLAFFVPTLNASTSYTRLSTQQFNLGTGQPASANATASLDARYELFNGGRNVAEARRSAAALEAAKAGEAGERFAIAAQVERAYYDVLGARELLEVGRQRLARAQEQLATARARVASGATVQSDSLQVLLEVQRAGTEVDRRVADLQVSQLELGRRVGSDRGVDAAPLDTLPPPALPLSLEDAVQFAATQGPVWLQARANERAAEQQLRARVGSYFPTVALTASLGKFDSKFFPSLTTRRTVGFTISLPIWDGAQRELALAQLRSNRTLATATRANLERSVRHDVTEAYTGYEVARGSLTSAMTGVAVAAEIYRVQDARYRAGAATVLELLDAQAQLVQAQADVVQARYGVRLARASLEVILGRRLSTVPDRSNP